LKSKYILAALVLCFLAGSFPIHAEEDEEYVPTYDLGNQLLIINGGLFLPLFFQELGGTIHDTNLSLGGVGSIQWAAHLNNTKTLGLEGGGMFAFSPNNRSLSISAGINFTRLGSSFQILPIVKPGVSAYWNYSSEWAFGVNFFYWWIPNIYTGPNPPKEQSRLGNFLEISLSAMYHF